MKELIIAADKSHLEQVLEYVNKKLGSAGYRIIIPSELAGDKMIFVTDHLSYYGVIGKETASPEEPAKPSVPQNPSQPPSDKPADTSASSNHSNTLTPGTSDYQHIIGWGILMICSGAAVIVYGMRRIQQN